MMMLRQVGGAGGAAAWRRLAALSTPSLRLGGASRVLGALSTMGKAPVIARESSGAAGQLRYPGIYDEAAAAARDLPFTPELRLVHGATGDGENGDAGVMPAFRVLDEEGTVLGAQPSLLAAAEQEEDTEGSRNVSTMKKCYRLMVRLSQLDDVLYNAQRQGRISFYMQSAGEEAIHIGSAHALSEDDMIFAQYREVGVLLYRGFSLQQVADQCFSNVDDCGKGRQMPVHYGSHALKFQTISSPLATQIPQASGAGYAMKRANALKPAGAEQNVVVCYFGEGAASEGDFHAALNFAATLECPVVFFCRNNGFAISTPVKDQFRGDGIVSRAAGYGMAGIRVDGNDIFAVYEATRAAREYALRESKPILVEAMTYRRGHHSTSDDSSRYRDANEVEEWKDTNNPISRMRGYLTSQDLWDDEAEQRVQDEERMAVLRAMTTAEKKPKAGLEEMFSDVYKDPLPALLEQEQELKEHMARHPEAYKDALSH